MMNDEEDDNDNDATTSCYSNGWVASGGVIDESLEVMYIG